MSASQSKKSVKSNNKDNNTSNNDQIVDVLYQKLGENWFAFSLIDDEVFMAPVSEDKIKEIKMESDVMNNIRVPNENNNEAA